jgi:effector-binding domain-containing protein
MRKPRLFALCLVLAIACIVANAYAEQKIDTPTRVYMKKTEPHSVAIMAHKGPFTDMSAVTTKLVGELDKGGYSQAGPIMAMFLNSPENTPQKDLKWQVMIPVAYPGPMGMPDNDKLGFTYSDSYYVAYIYHIGPYEKVNDSYQILFDWAKRANYKILGNPVEIYWSDPSKTPKEKTVTEIWIPIEEKKTPGLMK